MMSCGQSNGGHLLVILLFLLQVLCHFRVIMAAAESSEAAQEFLECGLCFENDELKRLPCNPNHIYCITCLTKDAELTKIIRCPQCRFVSC